MKANKQHSALEVIKKEQLKRRVFTVEFKAEVVRHKKAENLTLAECGKHQTPKGSNTKGVNQRGQVSILFD